MKLNNEFIPQDAPVLDTKDLSIEEKKLVKSVQSLLFSIYGFCRTYAECVALFDFCEDQLKSERDAVKLSINYLGPMPDLESLWFPWKMSAAQSGVFAARNYITNLKSLKRLVGKFQLGGGG